MSGEPILVTGSHRSGTTWVGRMLCASGEAAYIHEPFNPRRRPGWTGDRVPYWFLHVTRDNERYYTSIVEDVLRFRYPVSRNLRDLDGARAAALFLSDLANAARYRVTHPRPLLKDPMALFAAEWLAERFGARVVVTIRNPLAFAGSIKRLDWQFRFRSWLAQPSLADGLLARYRDEMVRLWSGEGDIVDQAVVMWNALHEVIDGYRSRHPEWVFVRHEDLSAAPQEGFAALYEHCGLTFNARAGERVASFSSAGNPKDLPVWRHMSVRRHSRAATETWRSRLTGEDVARVRSGTAEVAARFYPE